ncbi:MAG: NADH-quinone oxidoreductase subunit J [Anaerolineales bacterium]
MPDATQVLFFLSAALILISAVLVVTVRNLIHAALWLIATLFGVAMLYILLEAGFLAVVQVVVYIGAIAILFIFAVMLTRRDLLSQTSQTNPNWPVALGMSALALVGVAFIVRGFGFSLEKTPAPVPDNTLQLLGQALVSPNLFVLPFEVASVLLLAALIGAVYIAMNKK